MPIKGLITHELTRLAAQGGTGRLECAHGNGKLTADVLAVDAIGCAVGAVSYFTPKLATANMPRLTKLSDELTKRLTYLLEPIGVIETDLDSATIQLRSQPPQTDDDGTQYYELLVRRGGDFSLIRWQKLPGQIRQQIPAHLTREVLARLASDFVAVAGA